MMADGRAGLFTRRRFLTALGGLLAGTVGLATYAGAVEPRWRLKVTRYAPRLPGWPAHMPLRIVFLTDLHIGEPHVSLERLTDIVTAANALAPDLVLLGGDYVGTQRLQLSGYPPEAWASILAQLRAPLGIYAVLGNHDWWHGGEPGLPPDEARAIRNALHNAGIPVLENKAVLLTKGQQPFWLLGLADQLAFWTRGRRSGADDLPGTLQQITDDAPAILLAHEPDIFVKVPARIALTLSGHTHGGQVRLFGWSPVVPSAFGNRFAYGHVVEEHRHLIVSAGLGTSILPIRFGVPPEIVVIDLGDEGAAGQVNGGQASGATAWS